MEQVRRKTRTYYFAVNGAILALIIVLHLLREQLGYPWPVSGAGVQIALAVGVAISGLVLPIWNRIYGFKRFAGKQAGLQDLIAFEKSNIALSAITFVLAPVAYLFDINLWVRYFVSFVAIYALYYGFPSDRKLTLDAKMLGIKLTGNGEQSI